MQRLAGDQPQRAGAFGDQHRAVGQEGQGPRVIEAAGPYVVRVAQVLEEGVRRGEVRGDDRKSRGLQNRAGVGFGQGHGVGPRLDGIL